MSTAGAERQGDRRPASKWGRRLTSACVALANSLAVNQLSSALGYKGLVGASVAAGVAAGVFWLRRLPPRSPLLRYSFRVLLLSAFVAVVAAFVARSTFTAYLALAAVALTSIAASLTVDFFVSCAVLGGASAVGAGVSLIADSLALTPHVATSSAFEPLVEAPEPIVMMAAGALAIGSGVALIVVRGTERVAPLVRIGIAIAAAGVGTVVAGRSSVAAITLVPGGLALAGFGIATLGVAGMFSWKGIKTPGRVAALCGIVIIAFDVGVHGSHESLPEDVSTMALGICAVVLGVGLHGRHGQMGWPTFLALGVLGVSIIGLGVTILIYPYLPLGKASIGTGIAVAILGGLCKTLILPASDRYPKFTGSLRHAGSNSRQRLLRPIERRFLSQTFHDGEAVAVRAYVRTGRRATRRT